MADLLAARGAVLISADSQGHAVLEAGGEAHAAVAERWPEVVSDGFISRGRLAAIVFDDPDALTELERLTHPAIADRILRLVDEAGDRPVVLEVPVLDGPVAQPSGEWRHVLVEAPASLRRARSIERGMAPGDVDRRMAAQPSREDRMAWADDVIVNEGTLEDLEAEVEALWRQLSAG